MLLLLCLFGDVTDVPERWCVLGGVVACELSGVFTLRKFQSKTCRHFYSMYEAFSTAPTLLKGVMTTLHRKLVAVGYDLFLHSNGWI